MKVLHIISSSGLYGAENVLLNICKLLKKNGHAPYLICLKNLNKVEPMIYLEAQKEGLFSKVFECKNKLDIKSIYRIKNFIKQEKIQLIHSHGFKSNLYALIVSKLTNIPMIVTIHLWTGETTTVKFYEKLDKFIIRGASKIIGVSPIIKNELVALNMKKNQTGYIPNGIDTDKFNSSINKVNFRNDFKLEDSLIIGVVGRLVDQKGHKYLIEVFKNILKIYKNIKLLIVGDGYLKDVLVQEAGDLFGDKIIFAGIQIDTVSVYNSIDIFALPSIDEGLPLVLLEAMSMGLPVIATRVGAIPDVVNVDKGEGFLIEPKDCKNLEESLLKLINNPKLRKEMGNKARKRVVSEFSLGTFYQKYMNVYKDVLNKYENN